MIKKIENTLDVIMVAILCICIVGGLVWATFNAFVEGYYITGGIGVLSIVFGPFIAKAMIQDFINGVPQEEEE